MAKKPDKDNIEFDDIELDLDMFDFDDSMGDDDPFASIDKRKPIEHFASAVKNGVVNKISDKGFMRRMLELALPKGYSQAFNAYDGLNEAIATIAKDNQSELTPHLKSLDAKLKNPMLRKMLPPSVREALENSRDSGFDSGSGEATSALTGELAALNSLFKMEAEEKGARRIKEAIDDVKETKRFDASMQAQSVISRGIGRLVGYQDKVLINYHRKSLEIGLRHLDVSARLFEETRSSNKEMRDTLTAIMRNTALPDFVKMRGPEVVKQQMRQRLIDSGLNSVSEWGNRYFGNLTKNASEMVGGALSGFNQMGSMSEMGMSRQAMAGTMAGGLVSELLSAKVIDPLAEFGATKVGTLAEKYGKNTPLARVGDFFSTYLTGLPNWLNEYAKSETTREGALGMAEESFKALLDRHHATNTIKGMDFEELDKPAYMDNMFHRTVVEIIPGFLSRIDRWTRLMATGEDEGETAYSFYEDGFVSRDKLNKQHMEIAVKQNSGNALRNEVDSLIREIGADGLSTRAIRALRRRLLYDMASINQFRPERYVDPKTWSSVDDEVAEELIDFFGDTYDLDVEGNPNGSEDAKKHLVKSREVFIDSAKRIKDFPARMSALSPQIPRSVWRQMGLSEWSGVGATDAVDLSKLYDALLGEDGDLGGEKRSERAAALKQLSMKDRVKLQIEETKRLRTGNGQSDEFDIKVGEHLGAGDKRYSAANAARGAVISPVVNVELPDLFMTSDTETHERLDRLIGFKQESIETDLATQALIGSILEMLPELASGAGSLGEVEGGAPAAGGSKGSILGRAWRGSWRGLGKAAKWTSKKLAKGMWGYTKWAGRMQLGALKLGFKGLVGAAKFPFKRRRGLGVSDIYEPGNPEPLLTAKEINSGRCIDVLTQKAVQSLKDITGPVIGPDGLMKITQEQFDKGLVNGAGESIASYLGKKTWAVGKWAVGGMLSYTKWSYGLLGRGIKAVAKTAYDQFVQADAYLPGETEPRMTWKLLKRGFYCKADGTPIKSYDEIDGAVYTIDNLEAAVVTEEELKEHGGMYTRNGSLLFKLGRGLVSMGQWGFGIAKKAGKAYWSLTKKIYKGMWEGVKAAGRGLRGAWAGITRSHLAGAGGGGGSDELMEISLDITYEQLRTQRTILDVLNKQFAEDDRDKWDSDGDGVRENSWADILRKRREKRAGKPTATSGNNGDVVEAIADLKDALENSIDELGDRVEDAGEESLLSQAADLAEIRGGKEGGRRGRAGKKGIMRRGLGALGRGVGHVARGGWGLAKFAGTAALGATKFLGATALGAAKVAGSAMAAALSAPVLLTAAAVAAVGIAGYYGYKWYTQGKVKVYPYFYLRMAQYGIDARNESQVKSVLALEELFATGMSFDADGTPQLNVRNIDVERVYEIFGITKGDDEDRDRNLLGWVSQRFRTIYLLWARASQQYMGNIKFGDLDSKMRPEDGTAFLSIVDAKGLAHIYNNDEMSPFDDDLDMDASDVADAIENFKDKIADSKLKDDPTRTKVPINVAKTAAGVTAVTVAKASMPGVNADGSMREPGLRLNGKTAIAAGDAAAAPVYLSNMRQVGVEATIDVAAAVRYKAYGLKDLEKTKCRQLYRLEDLLMSELVVSNKSATLRSGIDDYMQRVETIMAPTSEYARNALRGWFEHRFLVVFLSYATACRKQYNGDIRQASHRLKGPQMHEVLSEAINATTLYDGMKISIWMVPESPWTYYQVETDISSVTDMMELLKSEEGTAASMVPKELQGFNPAPEKKGPQYTPLPLPPDAPQAKNPYATTAMTQRPPQIGRNSWSSAPPTGASLLSYGVEPMKPSGEDVKHPGNGSGGDINQIPVPLGDGPDGVRETIHAAAKMLGFDPDIAMTIAGIESTWRVGAGAGTTSAKGLYQFVDGTWALMMSKYASKFGIAPGTSPFDARANALLGIQYLIDNYGLLKSKYGKVTDTMLYKAHFLGPKGVVRFLNTSPNLPSNMAVSPEAFRANPGIFRDKSGRIRTVAEVTQELENRMKSIRKAHGGTMQVVASAAKPTEAPITPEVLPVAEPPAPSEAESEAVQVAEAKTTESQTKAAGAAVAKAALVEATTPTKPPVAIKPVEQTASKTSTSSDGATVTIKTGSAAMPAIRKATPEEAANLGALLASMKVGERVDIGKNILLKTPTGFRSIAKGPDNVMESIRAQSAVSADQLAGKRNGAPSRAAVVQRASAPAVKPEDKETRAEEVAAHRREADAAVLAAQEAQRRDMQKLAEATSSSAGLMSENVATAQSMDATLKQIHEALTKGPLVTVVNENGEETKHSAGSTIPKNVHSTARRNAVT